MRRPLHLAFLCAFCGLTISTNAQLGFFEPQLTPCYDGTTLIHQFSNWTAYQTLEDTYDGTIDSTACIDTGTDWGIATFDASQFNPSKPVFFKWHTINGHLLMPDQLYKISLYTDLFSLLPDQQDCEDDVCNGFMVRVRVPDNPNDADTLPEYRWHKQEFVQNEGGEIAICLPSEYFVEGNYLDEVILKFTLNEGATNVTFYEPYLDYVWMSQTITSAELPSYNQSQFNYYLWDYQNYLVLREATSFPSADSIGYLDVSPIPNSAEQAVVNFELGEYASLSFQPFTDLRGGLVEGDDSIRHYLNLINDGTICMTFFIELVASPGGIYTHRKGKIETSWGTCMRFQPDATLRIAPHAHLEYGHMGMGMLALQSGAQVDMQESSSMLVNGTIRMFNEPWQTDIESIHVDLSAGNSLIFGPYATIENFSTNEAMKLVIHMNGGYLDVRNLSEEELNHIQFVYPDNQAPLDWLQMESLISDNQMVGACRVIEGEKLNWQVHNMAGQLIMNVDQVPTQNYAQFEVTTYGLETRYVHHQRYAKWNSDHEEVCVAITG